MTGRDIGVHTLEDKHGIPAVKCIRCGYEWVPRHLNKPQGLVRSAVLIIGMSQR